MSGLTDLERQLLTRMEAIAGQLPSLPDTALDEPLREFFGLLQQVGDFARVPSARLLEQAAQRSDYPTTQVRLYHASARLEIPPPTPAVRPEPWEFAPGMRVRVKREFTDFDGQVIPAGSVLTFRSGSYFPYDGGHTWQFDGRTVRLAEIADQEDIIENRSGA
ncbi:MAG: hypothetical protein ABI972_02570 [Acidobacteriota bacterium]